MNRYKKCRAKFLDRLTHTSLVKFIFKIRNKQQFNYSLEDLLQFPEGTLGKDLALELQRNNFTLLKNYERHDCKHIILGFPMNEFGEACMQFFLLGTRHYSIPQFFALGFCVVFMPDYWKDFYTEFKRGRTCPKLAATDYNKLVHLNTMELQSIYQNK